MPSCPDCGGTGLIAGIGCGERGCQTMTIKCFFCKGAGGVTDEAHEKYLRGKDMRADRLARGLSLREEAIRLGVTPRALNDLEHGRIVDSLMNA